MKRTIKDLALSFCRGKPWGVGWRNLNYLKLLHVLFCSSVAVLYQCSERGRRLSQAENRHHIPPPRPLTTGNYNKNSARRNQLLVIKIMIKSLKACPEHSQHTESPQPADSFTLLRVLLPTFICTTAASNSCCQSSQYHRLCGQQKSLLTHAHRSASASGIITYGPCISIGNWRGGVFPEGAEAAPVSP